MDSLSKLAVSLQETDPEPQVLHPLEVIEDGISGEDPTSLFRLLIIATILLLLFMTLSGHIIEKCKVSTLQIMPLTIFHSKDYHHPRIDRRSFDRDVRSMAPP